MATQVHRTGSNRRARRVVTSTLVAATVTILVGLALGTTNPWRLVVLDEIAEMRILLGWSLAGLAVALGWLHLPRGAVRISFVGLVLLIVLAWTAGSYPGTSRLAGDPLIEVAAPDGTTTAGVIATGFEVQGYAVYLQSNQGLSSRRVDVPIESSAETRPGASYSTSEYLIGIAVPSIVFTAADTIVIRSDCGVTTVGFEPADLSITRIETAEEAPDGSTQCG